MRKRNLSIGVATRRRVLLNNLRKLPGRKAPGEPNQRRPESAMNERDLSVNESADENLIRLGNRFEDLEDVMTPRVCPPAPGDRFTDDGFGESGYRTFGRNENDTVLPDKGQRIFSGHALVHHFAPGY